MNEVKDEKFKYYGGSMKNLKNLKKKKKKLQKRGGGVFEGGMYTM